jgi:hypothetical protein
MLYLVILSSGEFLRPSLFLITLAVWRSAGQVLCRIGLYVYLMIRLELGGRVWARPRNLTGRDGRLRKDKRQKTNVQKAEVRWAGCSDGDTQQPCLPPASLLCTVANKEVEQQFWGGGHDIVVTRSRRNLPLLLFECPLLQLGAVPTQPVDYWAQLCSCQVLIIHFPQTIRLSVTLIASWVHPVSMIYGC